MASDSLGWRDEFVLARDLRSLGRHADLVSAIRRDELVPTIRGVYRRASAITTDAASRGDDAFRARVRATHLLAPEPLVYCSHSAAVVWNLPMVGAWPDKVPVLVAPSSGGRSNATLARTTVGNPAPTELHGGLLVTTLCRTVVDIGRVERFGAAVAMADAALHGQESRRGRPYRAPVERSALVAELSSLGAVHGAQRCRGVLDFADGASASAGESVSRVAFRLLGLPPPSLQVPFQDSRGLIGVVDFFWPHLGLVGEFDGLGKYVRDEFTGGRSVAEIVMAEKKREDRLRALGLAVVRWEWDVARSLSTLRAHLAAAGLR